jgi:hypothetical protein
MTERDDGIKLSVLSLGVGVQSTTLALMAAHGELDDPIDVAIFADTGCEPRPVYEQLKWLTSGNVKLPFQVHVVSAGSLSQEIRDAVAGDAKSHGRPPLFVRNPDGSAGMIRRQCTGDYKIDPIRKKVRDLLGLVPRQHAPRYPVVEQVIGISLDEKQRAKDASERWIQNRWPLIEKGMTRWDCYAWLERHGYPIPPKSACTICPMRSNTEWRWLKDNDPVGWAEAVEIDNLVRSGMKNLKAEEVFLHRSLVPLAEVDLSNLSDFHDDLFDDECQGMCGL